MQGGEATDDGGERAEQSGSPEDEEIVLSAMFKYLCDFFEE